MENSLAKFDTKMRSAFDQKGGTLGLFLLGAGIVALLAFGKTIFAAVLSALTSIFWSIILVIAIACILYVAFDPKARKILATLYMMGIQKLMGLVVKMNPIVIMEDGISKLWKRIDYIEEKMGKLNGIYKAMGAKIRKRKQDVKDCLDRKEIALQKGDRETAAVEDRQAVRLTELTKEYIELEASAKNWYDTLDRLAKLAKLTAEDATNEVEVMKEKYEIVKTSHNVFSSVMSVIKGDPDDFIMYNQAVNFVNTDMMEKIGQMDRVINTTGGLLSKMDIEKEIFSIKGADISKQYKELGIDSLFQKMEALPSHQLGQYLSTETMAPKPTTVFSDTKSKYFN